MTALYKILDQVDGSFNGGTGTWHLPKNGDPGAWMPEIEGDLEPCVRGYHLCSFDNLLEWAGPTLYEAEYEGEIISCDNKVVVRKARLVRRIETWNDKNLRLFAAECAEHVLWIYEKPGGTSDAPKNAILVAREFAHGRASKEELAAARAAAWAAARDAAWDAARAAAWAAAWDAARDAARDAAWDGCSEGCSEGCSVGCSVGCSEGCSVGCSEGCSVGCSEGCSVGCSGGCSEGCSEGCRTEMAVDNSETIPGADLR